MIAYQDRIVVAAEQCHLYRYNYDRAFRLKLSHNPSLGLTRPRAVGIMVYGTRQAILHQMHQIWPHCGSLFPMQATALPFVSTTGQKMAVPSACNSTTLHAPTPSSASTPTCASNVKGSTPFFVRHLQWQHHYLHSPIDAAQNYAPTLTKHGVHAYSTPSDTVPASATTAPVLHESQKLEIGHASS